VERRASDLRPRRGALQMVSAALTLYADVVDGASTKSPPRPARRRPSTASVASEVRRLRTRGRAAGERWRSSDFAVNDGCPRACPTSYCEFALRAGRARKGCIHWAATPTAARQLPVREEYDQVGYEVYWSSWSLRLPRASRAKPDSASMLVEEAVRRAPRAYAKGLTRVTTPRIPLGRPAGLG
jgi:hypothetical protein